MTEIWKDIDEYNGLYQVSNTGKVKALSKKVNGPNGSAIRKEKIMNPAVKKNKYLFVYLHKNGTKRAFYIHRLVATAFIPNPENKPQVNHINSDKSDNRSNSLEWATESENLLHSFKMGTHKPMVGTISPAAKLNDDKAIDIKTRYEGGGISIRKLATEYGVHHSIIDGIIKGKRWPHITIKKSA